MQLRNKKNNVNFNEILISAKKSVEATTNTPNTK